MTSHASICSGFVPRHLVVGGRIGNAMLEPVDADGPRSRLKGSSLACVGEIGAHRHRWGTAFGDARASRLMETGDGLPRGRATQGSPRHDAGYGEVRGEVRQFDHDGG